MQIGGRWVNGSGSTIPEHYPAGLEIDWIWFYKKRNNPVAGQVENDATGGYLDSNRSQGINVDYGPSNDGNG